MPRSSATVLTTVFVTIDNARPAGRRETIALYNAVYRDKIYLPMNDQVNESARVTFDGPIHGVYIIIRSTERRVLHCTHIIRGAEYIWVEKRG